MEMWPHAILLPHCSNSDNNISNPYSRSTIIIATTITHSSNKMAHTTI